MVRKGIGKLLIRGNTIVMVLLVITHVVMENTAIEARNRVHDPDRSVRLESTENEESSNTRSYNIHNTCLYAYI